MANEAGGERDGLCSATGKGNAGMVGEVTLEDCECLAGGAFVGNVDADAGAAALVCCSAGLEEGFQ